MYGARSLTCTTVLYSIHRRVLEYGLRGYSTSSHTSENLRLYSNTSFNHPKDGNELLRPGGISSLFRLPIQEGNPKCLDACFVGIPMDNGCSNRSGTRHGPRAIRNESCMIRHTNMTGAIPFDSLQVADIGDVPIVPYNMQRTVDIITKYFMGVMDANCIPLTMGGDHTLTYPILRAIKKKHGAVGLIQIDAHTDLADNMMGEKVAHGTPFRRAIEEELVNPRHIVQIGLRGSIYNDDFENIFHWAKEKVRMHWFFIYIYTSRRTGVAYEGEGELDHLLPKFEHIFVAVITFPPFLLCIYF